MATKPGVKSMDKIHYTIVAPVQTFEHEVHVTRELFNKFMTTFPREGENFARGGHTRCTSVVQW